MIIIIILYDALDFPVGGIDSHRKAEDNSGQCSIWPRTKRLINFSADENAYPNDNSKIYTQPADKGCHLPQAFVAAFVLIGTRPPSFILQLTHPFIALFSSLMPKEGAAAQLPK